MNENNETTSIVVRDDNLYLGGITVKTPADVIAVASNIATSLAKVINDRKLYIKIRNERYVKVEGWTTLGAMLGILPREAGVKALDDGSYEATVELVRISDGMIVGRGSAICSINEQRWAKADENARRSMAITRATGKAYRLGFSWIMTLAGYSPTPAEEMPVRDDDFEEEHWTRTQDWEKFWRYTSNLGLTREEVLEALAVSSPMEFTGSKQEAQELLQEYAALKRQEAGQDDDVIDVSPEEV